MSRIALIWAILAGMFLLAVTWVFLLAPGLAESRWRAARAALEAKGEKLSLADFPRSKVRDEENFFSDPLWRANIIAGRFEIKTGFALLEGPFGEDWNTDILDGAVRDPAEVAAMKEEYPEFANLLADPDRAYRLQNIWVEPLLEPDEARRAAELTLRVQEPARFFVDRLSDLSSRPEAWFPRENMAELSIAARAPRVFREVEAFLEARVKAMLVLGNHRAAFEDIVLIFRFQQALRHEFIRDSWQLEVDLAERAIHLVNRGIRLHAWTAEELRGFDKELSKVDAPARLARVLRNQRALMLDVVWPSIRDGAPMPFGYQNSQYVPGYWFYRTMWMPGDQQTYCLAIQELVEALDAVPANGMNARTIPDWRAAYPDRNPHGWAKLPKFLSWEWGPSRLDYMPAAKLQAEVSLARVGIALELYRLQHGEYPESLDALKPEFPDGMPVDIVTLRPFHYKRNADGTFSLWSVGWNETDEGGWRVKAYDEGDWAWGE